MPEPGTPYVVGLTGGIGAGKSAAAAIFQELGIEVIDADAISRELVRPGSPALQEITGKFGNQLLQPDGSLNRSMLRQLVFTREESRHWLESLLHPLIRTEITRQIRQSTSAWLILMVPLLLETSAYDFIQRVLVVDVPESVQINRVCQRDAVSQQHVQDIMAKQMSRRQRLQLADDVLDNAGTADQLKEQVTTLVRRYEELAHDWHQTG